MADLSKVHPGDHAQPRRQPLQEQADDGGAQQQPQELVGGEQDLAWIEELTQSRAVGVFNSRESDENIQFEEDYICDMKNTLGATSSATFWCFPIK